MPLGPQPFARCANRKSPSSENRAVAPVVRHLNDYLNLWSAVRETASSCHLRQREPCRLDCLVGCDTAVFFCAG